MHILFVVLVPDITADSGPDCIQVIASVDDGFYEERIFENRDYDEALQVII